MTKWTPAQMPDQTGKVAIVTGANIGLGYHTALELARKGATVVMACRNQQKAQAALAELKREVPDAKVEVLALDLADLDSVKAFVAAFRAKYQKLDLLLNNAGVMALPLCRTAQGFEMQIGTNHFGHFALTGQLLDLLEATPGARIVNTSSLAHTWTRAMDLDDPNFERRGYWKWDAYGKSKLANLLFTYELQRRLAKSGTKLITAAAHPGYAATNLQLAGPEMAKSAVGKVAMVLANKVFAQSAAQGAWPQLYAATMPQIRGGEFVGPDGLGKSRGYPEVQRSNRASRDEGVAAKLWSLSEQLTGTRFLSA
jgi:NAD(P)-dependent dehydrogenase (short-subunit alcohol dehydrogenase family)